MTVNVHLTGTGEQPQDARNRGLFGLISAFLGDAIGDIREQLITRGWFGQAPDAGGARLAEWGSPEAKDLSSDKREKADPWGWDQGARDTQVLHGPSKEQAREHGHEPGLGIDL
ncbi:hypothetical protein [Jiella pacifica]|uniref:Uncharacterized protein n=1 Tax=Jiella pacifica TaxID=2696469 RepID=A0A6N9T9A3_9HYPH|nr:hypothetical protein [Jiella pacifica]NDW07831.1 hypothetical protein [Jiella pacifica]